MLCAHLVYHYKFSESVIYNYFFAFKILNIIRKVTSLSIKLQFILFYGEIWKKLMVQREKLLKLLYGQHLYLKRKTQVIRIQYSIMVFMDDAECTE